MLLTNGKIISWEEPNQIYEKHAMYIQGEVIQDIGLEKELKNKYPDEEIIDAGGQFIMPGNICAHTHFYGAYARGLAIPGPAPKDFPEILDKLWWPLDKSLTLADVRASAEVMLIDAIKHGTTTLIDHHASPNAIDGSLDVIADVVEKSGVRAVLCYEVTDRDGEDKSQAGIAENVRFIHRVSDREKFPRIRSTFGLHAGLTLTDETLDRCREAAPTGVGFHIHVAEHEVDEYDSLAKSGMRVVDRLHRHGILTPQSIIVHGVHIDAREINLLAESGAWVTHQPRSNMNNAVGTAQVEAMMRSGIPVCLGTDGFSHTMWAEWKAAYLSHKLWNRDPRRMNGMDVADMAVYNNASLAGMFFNEHELGVIRPGAHADIIFVEYHPYTPLTADNLPWHILFGFHESMVTTTIVAGKVLMKDRTLATLNEEAITAKALEQASQVWKRYYEQFTS